MTLPRLLVIMGSGETSPTMVKPHRRVFERLGPPPVPAVLLDTPFGFQANADDISARAVEYFDQSVGVPVDVASWRSADRAGTLEGERVLAGLRSARWVFAGPGSPSYALRQWDGTPVPEVLAEKLTRGGCITFASAAALTLGVVTVPVYEIYKVGADPHWLPGLDLLALAGLRAAVIPHYDNAEGGHHDTRYCYLGEWRLAAMEQELPDDAFVLGVDEHTGLILDLDGGEASVVGLGGATVRRDGRSVELPTGTTVPIDDLRHIARATRPGATAAGAAPAGDDPGPSTTRSPLLDDVHRLRVAFDAAVERRDADGAVAAVLELDDLMRAWSRDTLESDELDRARSVLRTMVVRLGELAEAGVRDPRDRLAPLVDALLDVRRQARAGGDYALADAVRDRLAGAGVEVRDTAEGTEWEVGPGLLS